jgi:hypothetical protein
MVVHLPNTREILIEKLAYVRACDQEALEAQIQKAGGDLEIDSKEGQSVASHVEVALGMDGLIRVEDQTKETLTTINSLEAMIESRRAETEGSHDG